MILKYSNMEFECDRAVKGADWIQCYTESRPTTRFSEIVDFSLFTLEGGVFEDVAPITVEQRIEDIESALAELAYGGGVA